jgi:hypothetical protein
MVVVSAVAACQKSDFSEPETHFGLAPQQEEWLQPPKAVDLNCIVTRKNVLWYLLHRHPHLL